MNALKRITALSVALLVLFSILTSCSSGDKNGRPFSPPSNGAGREEGLTEQTDETPAVLPSNGKTVIIDPGHGFRDPGAGAENYELGEGKDERYVTLQVSLLLKTELEKLGYSVIMTHEGVSNPEIEQYLDDNYYDPNDRVAFVNSKTADYFISLHCNLFDDPEVKGAKFYYWDNPIKVNHDSELIAQYIIDAYKAALPDKREPTLDVGNYAVIREITLPSCLVEMGFVSNPDDAADLVDPEWQKTFAAAVAAGIDRYFFPKTTEETGTAQPTDTSSFN